MDHEIEAVPAGIEGREGGIDGGDVLHVAGHHEIGADRLGERRHALAQGLALVGEGKLGPVFGQDLGDAPGNRVVVRDAHDEAALPLHQTGQSSPLVLRLHPSRPVVVERGLTGRDGGVVEHIHEGPPFRGAFASAHCKDVTANP
jgi:hypothetical protein